MTMEENILKPEISFPQEQYSGASVRNLINLLYSRGKLISKAIGGDFGADEGLVEALKDDSKVVSTESAIAVIREYSEAHENAVRGVTFADGKVSFTGFPEEGDPGRINAFTELASGMHKQAVTQKRIQAKQTDDPNEKYIFRVWLVRIGMGGADYKDVRRYLLENLEGHTAFHTAADEEKWKERQKAKKASAQEQEQSESEEE
jgi:hypothetical protein